MILIKSTISAHDIYTGETISLTLLGSSAPSNLDSYLRLYGNRVDREAISQDDSEVAQDSDTVLNSYIGVNPHKYGTYFLGGKL